MAQQIDYACTRCGGLRKRNELITKKVSFSTLGSEGKMIRSRTLDWLCFSCTKNDPEYNIPEYESPGLRHDEAMRQKYSSGEGDEVSTTEPEVV